MTAFSQVFIIGIQLAGLLIIVLIDPYIHRKQRRVMLLILSAVGCLMLQNMAEYSLSVREASLTVIRLRTATSVIGYSLRPLIIVLFFFLIRSGRRFRLALALTALNCAVHCTAFFSRICFWFDEENHYQRGPLGATCLMVSAVLLVWLLVLTVREYGAGDHRELWLPVVSAAVVVAGTVMDTLDQTAWQRIDFLTMSIVCSCYFYFIWLHLQYVHEHEEETAAGQRMQIMMTQIQPHFLYNTLATIQVLCRTNPEKAFETTGMFARYLRQNIDSLDQPALIPLQKELEHTRIYTEIEMIRFPNVRVEYRTDDMDISIPALTIQPLVENAIRHGVRIREEGLVTVETRRAGRFHEIIIADNGIGFDPAILQTKPSGHIGLRNVKERLENMCSAEVTIESVPQAGTRITIRIPADEKTDRKEQTDGRKRTGSVS